MRVCTVYADASVCPTSGAGGWGAWIRKGDRVVLRGGTFKNRVTDSGAAEMAAAANGIAVAAALGMAGSGDLVVVVSDCEEVVRNLCNFDARRNPRYGRMVQAAAAAAKRYGFGYKVNKVAAHSRGSARETVNNIVDAEAKRHMRAAREIVTPARTSRQDKFEGTPIPACGTAGEMPSGGIPALYEPQSPDCADVELLVAKPYVVDRHVAGALDLALEMWSNAFMGREQFKRALLAAANGVRRHHDKWEHLCAATSVCSGEPGWSKAPGSWQRVTPEEVVASIMHDQRRGHEGIRRTIVDAFPEDSPGHAAAWPEVALAARITGHDCFLFKNADGSCSYATLRPGDIRVLEAEIGPSGPAPSN
jgi:ribonuclease HI